MEDGYMDPTPLQGRIVAPTGNDDHGAPSTSTATAGRIVATTSSVHIYNGIMEGAEPSRKRLKPSSSSGETTPTLGMTAATTTAADQELQQQQQQQPSSAAKRRAPGILTTALGWARSQAADLASFQEIKASEGPEKPLPQLPLPTRRLAAAHHDMVKAAANQKKGLRRGGGGINSSLNHISTVDYQQQQQQQRPVSVAFATGTDPQLASVLGAELTRLGDLAQADPAKYAALAEECKLWAAGTTASVGGLTATDLEKAQYQLKAAMQHVPFSGGGGGAPNSSDGYRSGNAAGVPMPDPRASSYFIQPGTNGGRDGNPPAGGATTHQPRQQPLFNAHSQYNNPQAHTGPGLSRLNPNSFAMNTAQGHPYYTANLGGSGGDGGGGVTHRYPRRSSRARNTKRDDVYLTLDSDDDRDDTERDDEDNEDHTGNRGWMRADMRRGPGRPRKMNNDSSNAQHYQDTYQQQQQQQFSPNLMLLHPVHQRLQHRTTPPSISPPGVASAGTGAPGGSMAFFSPNLGDVLSPFAQFLFEHSPDGNPPVGIAAAAGVVDVAVNGGGGAGGGILQGVQGTSIDLPRNTAVAGTIAGNDTTTAAAAAGNADADAVDYAALDEFISGLNFTNDAVLGSPSAMAMLAGAKAAAAAAGTTVVVLPGMIPTGDSGGAINYTASDINNASLQPETGGAAATGAAPLPTAPAHHLDPQNPAAQLPILDLAICKPLETPTVAGMLSLGLSKKSPTPITSPLLSPTLLALNF